jgi:hypothetical protein
MAIKDLIYTAYNVQQAVNTKEEAEVLESLFAGTHAYQDSKTLRDVKASKIIDMF